MPRPFLPLVIGVAVGTVLAFVNALMGLKTGLWDTGQLTCALLGFSLMRPISWVTGSSRTIEDHVRSVTAGSALAAMPATMGLLASVPSLIQMGQPPSAVALVLSAITYGGLGIAVGALLAPRLLDQENLPFPTGVATAELIRSLESSREELLARTVPFAISFAIAFLLTVARDAFTWIPTGVETQLAVGAIPLSLALAASPMLVGSGALIGLRIGLSMLAGVVLLRSGCAWYASSATGATLDADHLTEWLRWPGVAMLLGGSIPALVQVLRQLTTGVSTWGQVSSRSLGWVGVLAASVVIVTHFGFDLSWGFSLAALLLAVVLATVVARSAGATDFAPLGDAGQLSQFVGALSGSAPASVAVAAVTANGGAQVTSTLWALRIGRILGTRVDTQLKAQALGVLTGAPITLLVWWVLTKRYAIGSPELPAPSAAQWNAVAALLHGGLDALPPGALLTSILCATLGLLLGLIEKHPKHGKWILAPLGLGLALLINAGTAYMLAIGAIAGAILAKRTKGEALVISIGSGLLAGEAIPVVGILLWQTVK